MFLLGETNGNIEDETWKEIGDDNDDDGEPIGRKWRDDVEIERRGESEDLEAKGRARVMIRAMAGNMKRTDERRRCALKLKD